MSGKIVIAADHAGYALKEALKPHLTEMGLAVTDAGTDSAQAVDYPDYGRKAAGAVSSGLFSRGILICGSGVGMSIVANRFSGVRAALCLDEETARLSRMHNDANILVLASRKTDTETALGIVRVWLTTPFEGGRHQRRLDKIREMESKVTSYQEEKGSMSCLMHADPEIAEAIRQETRRQAEKLEMIASENFVSEAVLEAQGSVMTNKYAEGYPGRRYYGGCEFVDIAERLAIERSKQLFGAEHANVQPHAGVQANMAVYFTVLQPGDTILGMNLSHGGHLSHGSPVSFSGKFYRGVFYGVDRKTETIDFNEVETLAKQYRPKIIVVGASSYPRAIDYGKFRSIADQVGALILADIAHIGGLVSAGLHPSPVPCCEFVTMTTHKTLRGPRGGLILCKKEFAQALDARIFPEMQGGPLMHIIAAKAVAMKEALTEDFKRYQQQIVKNAKTLADALIKDGFRLVSGGTDNHLMLIDLTDIGITGKEAQEALDRTGITVNKNRIPFDTRGAQVTSGIRIGTPALTTRGMKEPEMKRIAGFFSAVLRDTHNEKRLTEIREEVRSLCGRFPLYPERLRENR